MIWDILEAKIVDAGLGQPGVSLFRGFMPSDVRVGVMFRHPLQGVRINPYIPGFYRPTLQAIVRHHDPVAGSLLAGQVMKKLTVQGRENHPATAERGAVLISMFYPRELPIQFPRLDGNGIEWSINFITAFSIEPLAD